MNILIITYWKFSDALIQTYTLPYLRIIRKIVPPEANIYLLTLEKSQTETKVQNIPEKERIQWISFPYQAFGWKAFIFWIRKIWELIRLIQKEQISIIHCWGTPAGAIGYVLSIITGRKLILDSYEPHAEAMVENGTWGKYSVAFRLLFWMEKLQTKRALYVISATEGMYDYAQRKYGLVIKNFYVKPACVNLDHFDLNNVKHPGTMAALGLDNQSFVCVYAGKFGGIYMEQQIFDFFAVAASYWGERFRIVLLTNSTWEEIVGYCKKSGISPEIVITKFVPHHEIPAYMGVGDFAVTPVKPVPSKRYCTPIKDGEYWALGLPVVIPANISDDSFIIEEYDIGAVLYELNDVAYLEAVIKIDELVKRPVMRETIRGVAKKFRNFSVAENIYKKIYSN